MGKFINNEYGNFTIVRNEVLNDKELSLQAKGLYSYFMSKPNDWVFSYKGLSSKLKESEETIIEIAKELVDKGLLKE